MVYELHVYDVELRLARASVLVQVSAAREAKSALEFVKFGGGPACGPAGSVSWRNGDTFTGAVTYDTGSLHVFDIRTEVRSEEFGDM